MPLSFLPIEDQGSVIVDAQTPPEAATGRTLDVAKRIAAHFAREPGIDNQTLLLGFNFSGQGQNAALNVVRLKPWGERGPNDGADAIAARANAALGGMPDAIAMSWRRAPRVGRTTGWQNRKFPGFGGFGRNRRFVLKRFSHWRRPGRMETSRRFE